MIKLSGYVKSIDGDLINLHGSKYAWKKTKNKTCVNKKFFIKQSDLEELIVIERN